jgi:hypothetical protein
MNPLTVDDFKHILYIIRDNHKKYQSLTHKKVRVYLDCMNELLSQVSMPDSYWLPSIKFHFYAMSCRISHEKRAFLAEELLKLLVLLKEPNSKQKATELESEEKPKQNMTSEEVDPDNIPFKYEDVFLSLGTSPENEYF